MFGKDDNQTAQFTGEPPRVSLTDPPAGYQTPSPNEPYGHGKERYNPKATDYLTEHGTAASVNDHLSRRAPRGARV